MNIQIENLNKAPEPVAVHLNPEPDAIVTFIEGCEDGHDIVPATVTVEGKTYPAARYVKDGRTALYVAGLLPSYMLQPGNTRTCVQVEGDPRDWYIACYYPEISARKQLTPKPEFSAFHPFGASFLLLPWTCEDIKIDGHEDRPWKRVPLEVNLL